MMFEGFRFVCSPDHVVSLFQSCQEGRGEREELLLRLPGRDDGGHRRQRISRIW